MLLGSEAGALSQYAAWLYEGNGPRLSEKSCVSGKETVFAYSAYAKNSKFASFDEVDLDQKYPPLSINDIKDIDSVFEAVADRAIYCGNMVLGNSEFVEGSSAITDSFYVLHSERVAFSKYVAYSTRGSYSENIFGCFYFGPAAFLIKCDNAWDCQRCLCVSRSDFSSDCHYSHGMSGCHDCMFSFNLKNKRNCIGNLPLPKEKHAALKAELLRGIAEKLKKGKRLPALHELIGMAKPDFSLLRAATPVMPHFTEEKKDKARIEKAFSDASGVLGLRLTSLDNYSKWLCRNSQARLEPASSCATGKPMLVPDIAGFLRFPKESLLSLKEAEYLGEHLALSEGEAESLTLQSAPATLSKIAFFCPHWEAGNQQNNIDCPVSIDSVDCYHGLQNMLSKKCGFCLLPRNCESCFGSREIRYTSFSFNCHFSTKLTRCFECDSCNNCSGAYFCHNCENVHDSMFCFNTKNKKYAIGNVEVGREKFLAAKEILLSWARARLEKSRALPLDIYSIAAYKQGKGNK